MRARVASCLSFLLLPEASGFATFPSSDSSAHIYWDGATPSEVPTTALPSGYASEAVHTFSSAALEAAGVVITDTHAIFPTDHKLIQAGHAQQHHAAGLTRAGISNMMVLKTAVSAFPGTVAMFASKFHITEQTGKTAVTAPEDWMNLGSPTQYEDFDQAPGFLFEQEAGAKWLERSRMSYEFVMGSNLVRSVLFAGLEPSLSAALTGMQAAGVDAPLPSLDSLSSKAAALSHGPPPAVLANQVNCFHFSEAPGMELSDASVAFPLAAPIVAYRGVIELPTHLFEIASGIATFHADAASGALEIRYAASGHFYSQQPEAAPAGEEPFHHFFQSPPDGESFPAEMIDADTGQLKDGRFKFGAPSAEMAAAYQQLLSNETDPAMLYLDTSLWCDAERVLNQSGLEAEGGVVAVGAAVLTAISDVIPTFTQPDMTPEMSVDSFMALMAQEAVKSLTLASIPCMNAFLNSNGPIKNYFHTIEMMGALHAVLEADIASDLLAFWGVYFNRPWNSLLTL